MAKRTGATKLQNLALAMCKTIVPFSAIIVKLYPENTSLKLAVEAANTACSVLYEELQAVIPVGD